MPERGSLIIRNAHILTMDAGQTVAEALAIQDGRIVAVGNSKDIAPFVGGAIEIIDAGGATVLPGFIDAHAHFTLTGLGSLAADLGGIDAIEQVLDRVATEAAGRPVDGLVIGLNFQPELNPEKRFPSPEELHEAGGGRPVYIMESGGHWSALSPAAVPLLGATESLAGLPVDEDGRLIGPLSDAANTAAFTILWERYASQVGLATAFEQAAKAAVAGGVTTLHAMEDLENVRAMQKAAPGLPVRLVPYTQTRDIEVVLALGLRQIGGCGQVMVDGDFGPQTAALLEPYADNPQTMGTLYYTDEELAGYVSACHRAGLQVALHCIGSGAIRQLLDAYEAALRANPRSDHRHRIEHFELPVPGQAERAKKLGVVLSVQPSFNHYWPHDAEYPQVLGWERAARLDPLRSLVEAGLVVALGSDSPVTPLNPLLWVHSAANHSNVAERVSVATALWMATQAGGWLAFEEGLKGSLEPGKLGDLVFLSKDPLQADPERLKEIRVLRTVVGGRVVFEK